MKKKSSSKIKYILGFLVLFCFGILAVFFIINLEGEKPLVQMNIANKFIGVSGKLSGTISDGKCGLRSSWIALSQGGKDHVLYEKKYPFSLFARKGRITSDPVELGVEPQRLGLVDGPVVLRIRVSDCSFRGWLSGNVTYIEKELVIDTRAPEIDVLSRNHNLVRGGAGLVIYRVSEADGKTGVKVGDQFYPGYSGYFNDPHIYLAFFALTHTQGQGTPLHIEAEDAAGNTARSGFMYYIGNKTYKKDRINISDGFLNAHMPSFSVDGFDADGDNLAKFLKINRDVRQENGKRIMSVGPETEHKVLWSGAFSRLPGSATRANYADHRSYFYKGKLIDKEYHLGVDLASVRHAPVPVANSGRVALVEKIGIYGKTVVVDHGFGLFSTYSHLSRTNVKVGDMVAKGDIIGNTGITGLTGGDHLHFGMFVDHVFVDPLQWWDSTWIENNITSKINSIKNSH